MSDICDNTRIVCPHCAASMDSTRPSLARRTCPDCGGAITEPVPIPWTDVARVTNLAEAGFLADELVGRGIDARIHQLEDFNALHDRWTAVYIIRVASDTAEEAANEIRQFVDDDVRERPANDELSWFSRFDRMTDPVLWRAVALLALTGIAGFMIGERFSEESRLRRLPPNSLPSAVNEIRRPFTTAREPGKPRYRLFFDSTRKAWTLDTDLDNDGRYDTRQQFHASGAPW